MIKKDLQLTEEDFESIDHFTLEEVLSKGEKLENIQYATMFTLNALRHNLNTPFIIHCISTGIHVDGSYHYQGIAADGHFTRYVSPTRVVQVALDCGFAGIGMYSWGWHFDLREDHALWKRVNGVYKPLIEEL